MYKNSILMYGLKNECQLQNFKTVGPQQSAPARKGQLKWP